MELSGAAPPCCLYRHVIAQRSLSSFPLYPERLFSQYVCHHLPPGNVFRITFGTRSFRPIMNSMLTAKKGHSIPISKGSYDTVWILETDLDAGQLPYITGDLPVLGGWQPKMAVQMLPTEDARLWKAEVKTPSGVNFKYNYFVVDETRAPSDISWRPGPEYSLSVPLKDEEDRRILVKDSWMKQSLERSLAHVWGLWTEETHLVESSISYHARDRNEIAKVLELEESGQMQSDLNVHASPVLNDDGRIGATYEGANLVLCDRDQPVEEPWLPTIFISSENEQITELASEGDFVKDAEVRLIVDNQDSLGKDRYVPVEENKQISKDLTPSTIILINSSTSTMQRIAVLEDGKLVELLIEPVKSDVVCDSIYLGVVDKLAPRMNGAFVDIGSLKTTFMDIKHYREPFVMEPQKTKKSEVGDSFLKIVEELQSDIQITDESDVSETIMSDDSEDHGDDDDLEFLSEHTNGNVLANEEADDNCQHVISGKNCLPEGAISSSPTVEQSNTSHVPNRHNQEDPKEMLVHKNKWKNVHKGSMIIVQVVREGLGTKGPLVTPYPRLRSRFWILLTRGDEIAVSKNIIGAERKRLKDIAKGLQPPGFGIIVRTVAAGHSSEELKKNLKGLLMTWKKILESASTAALSADRGNEGAVPVMLHQAMGQTLSVVQDNFSEKVKKVVVDSPGTYHEVLNYLQDIAPDLCDRVELYDKRNMLFGEYEIEEEINNILSKRVPLANGGSLVIEQTEALVSIDVNGGHMMIGQGISQEKASLDVNLAAAKQIARELRLRDIGGIIVVDFIDMGNEANKRLVYQEMKRAVEKDRSNLMVKVSELSENGLMEITRKRVRPSVTFMISDPCTCCDGTGRVEALETTLSKIEQDICRLLASRDQEADPENPETWPKFRLWVDHDMFQYITSGKRTRLAILSSSLNVWLISKVNRGFSRGSFKLEPFDDDTESDDVKSQSQRLQVPLQSKHLSVNPKKKRLLWS